MKNEVVRYIRVSASTFSSIGTKGIVGHVKVLKYKSVHGLLVEKSEDEINNECELMKERFKDISYYGLKEFFRTH